MMQAGYAVLQPLLRGLGNVALEPESGDATHDCYSGRTDQPPTQRVEAVGPRIDAVAAGQRLGLADAIVVGDALKLDLQRVAVNVGELGEFALGFARSVH